MMQDIATNPEKYLDNENENTCKDGSRVWVLWRNKPIHGEDGSLGVDIGGTGATASLGDVIGHVFRIDRDAIVE